jgi:hypothetical protein
MKASEKQCRPVVYSVASLMHPITWMLMTMGASSLKLSDGDSGKEPTVAGHANGGKSGALLHRRQRQRA